MPGQSIDDLRSINQISLLSVNLKFNGCDPGHAGCCGAAEGRKPMQAGRRSASRTVEVYDVLPPEAGPRRSAVRPLRPAIVEDAVFEVLPAQPRREHNDNPSAFRAGRRFDAMRLLATAGVYLVNRLERLLAGLSPQSFMTLIASLFFLVFWLLGGFAGLATTPVERVTSAFSIEQVFTEEIDENGMRLLAVGGVLRNQSSGTRKVTPVSVVGEGGDIIGAIIPPARELGAGQSVRFFSRFKLAGGKSGAITIFPTAG